jgi:DNA-directed RNA polymerase specialized sigma subunit
VAKRSRDQLSLLTALGLPEDKLRTEDHLATPLSREEQRAFGKLYAENIGLVKFFANKLTRKYGYCMATEDINSCVDFAAIKAFRAWKPERGKLSTILWSFALGECLHFLRSSNWGIKAPHKVRELGNAARKLVDQGMSPEAICVELNCNRQQLKEALVATAGIAHDVKGFDLHCSHYPTPMDWLERQEELAMAAT